MSAKPCSPGRKLPIEWDVHLPGEFGRCPPQSKGGAGCMYQVGIIHPSRSQSPINKTESVAPIPIQNISVSRDPFARWVTSGALCPLTPCAGGWVNKNWPVVHSGVLSCQQLVIGCIIRMGAVMSCYATGAIMCYVLNVYSEAMMFSMMPYIEFLATLAK